MLDNRAINYYFRNLPLDFIISIHGQQFRCNKQSFSCFSEVLNQEVVKNPQIKEYKMPDPVSPKAVNWLIRSLSCYQEIEMSGFDYFEAYLASAALEVECMKSKLEGLFVGTLRPDDFPRANEILMHHKSFLSPLVNYLSMHMPLFVKYSKKNILDRSIYEKIFTLPKFFESEDAKVDFLHEFTREKGDDFLSLYSTVDIRKLSKEKAIVLFKHPKKAKVEHFIRMFPYLKELVNGKRKLEEKILALGRTYEQKKQEKEEIIYAGHSPVDFDIFIANEEKNLKKQQAKLAAVADQVEFLASSLEVLLIGKRTICQIVDYAKFVADSTCKITELGKIGNKGEKIITQAKLIKQAAIDIINEYSEFNIVVNEIPIHIQYFIGFSQSLRVFLDIN